MLAISATYALNVVFMGVYLRTGRSDDTEELIRERYKVYETNMLPVKDAFASAGTLVSVRFTA
jgi:adenylate kinase family enzyme